MDTGYRYWDDLGYRIISSDTFAYSWDSYSGALKVDADKWDQQVNVSFYTSDTQKTIRFIYSAPLNPFLVPKPGSFCNSLLNMMEGFFS